MRSLLLLPLSALLCACAPVDPAAPPARVIPQGAPPESISGEFDRAAIEQNLLATARERFGEAAVRRALAAPIYLFAKVYHGRLPPPQPGAPPYRPPMALLIHENGQWLAAGAEGFRPASPSVVTSIRSLLNDRAFWSTPDWSPQRCPDAAATLLMLKVPSRREIVRSGNCGDARPTERIVFLALDA